MAVNMIEHGDYDLLEQDLGAGLSVRDLREAVAAYPVRLVAPPVEIYDTLDILQEPDVVPLTFHVAVRLWTEHDEPSRVVVKFVSRKSQLHPVTVDTQIVGLDLEDL